MSNYDEALNAIDKLSQSELDQLVEKLFSRLASKPESTESVVSDERFKNGLVCPHCGCTGEDIVRNGHYNGKQRYFCKACGRSFMATSNSIISGSQKGIEVWKKFIYGLLDGFSIRKLALICGIHRNTAFYWRHKIGDIMAERVDNTVFHGISEGDETHLPLSFKGNHSNSEENPMNRPPHKRGGSIRTRGLSEEQVCIPCAVSRGGVAYAKVSNLGSISTEELVRFYTGKFADDATFVTDSLRAYKRAAKELNVPLIQVKGGKAKKGIYNIQSVNAYHSQLKAFLRGFNGVSTKYLNNYLALSNYANYENYASSEQRDSLLKDILAAYRTIKCRTIRKRPAIPVIC